MTIWIAYFESANYAGYGMHCLVKAASHVKAKELASDFAEEYYYEEDADQYLEEHGEDADTWAVVVWVEVLDEDHPCWPYVNDPVQQEAYYPKVNYT